MAPPYSSRSRWMPGMGAFCVCIGFIVAATVLNIAHDRLSGFKMDTLPLYIGALYAYAGKLGVTVVLVAMGLIALAAGSIIQRLSPEHPRASLHGAFAGTSAPYFCTGGSSTSTPVPTNGRIVLETSKYVTPQHGTVVHH